MAKNIVDNPIINEPWEEPLRYWDFKEEQPQIIEGRRPAGYYFRPRTRSATGTLAEEEFVELSLVNEIRKRVKFWRESNYPGVTPTPTTRRLLEYWNSPERERRLFFCQREAVETIIWLVEAPQTERQGIEIPKDEALLRYACKMATASGKTVVMAMLIAWSVLNKLSNPRDKRFSDAVLVVCPNLTIRERLQVLKPTLEGNYYQKFDLVPPSLLPLLTQAKIMATNWHAFLPQDDADKKGVLKRGPESDTAFCTRVLKDLGSKGNILVINDEAHHAYRPAPEEKGEEVEKATIWIEGLERINRVRNIKFCLDFSATPFYLKGTGYEEGAPFPWIVSDFGLVDAIESGIVKIPRVPVDDNTGEPIPRYFHVWSWIMEHLPSQERATARRKAKPEPVFRMAEDALITLASEWKKEFDQKSTHNIPPVMITVCDNTDLAEIVAKHIGEGKIQAKLENKPGFESTLRIDTKLLEKAESALEGQTRKEAAEALRKKVATVGKEGEPGEQIQSNSLSAAASLLCFNGSRTT